MTDTSSPRSVRRLRVMIAKPGLDGHDRGARVITRLLRDEGYEVLYTGLRQRPAAIARAAADEDVDVVGLSVLSGAHQRLGAQVVAALAVERCDDVAVVVGGTIPPGDVSALLAAGVAAVFGVGSTLADIRTWFSAFNAARVEATR